LAERHSRAGAVLDDFANDFSYDGIITVSHTSFLRQYAPSVKRRNIVNVRTDRC
jgi:hypothetical protein